MSCMFYRRFKFILLLYEYEYIYFVFLLCATFSIESKNKELMIIQINKLFIIYQKLINNM